MLKLVGKKILTSLRSEYVFYLNLWPQVSKGQNIELLGGCLCSLLLLL